MNASPCSAAISIAVSTVSVRARGAPAGSEQNEAHLSITHAALQVDHLAFSKVEQLLGGHLAQRVDHRIFSVEPHLTGSAECEHFHGSPSSPVQRIPACSVDSGVRLRAEQFDNDRT